MIRHLTNFISRITRLSTVLIFAVLIIAIETGFNAMLPRFVDATGGTLLDMSVWFTADFAYERLHSFGNAADVYFLIRMLDFIFPAAYAFGLSVLCSMIYRKKYTEIDNYRWILAIPFSAALFDYVENLILVVLYRLLPSEYPAAASVLNIITLIKFTLLAFGIFLLVTGIFSLIKGGDSMLLSGNKFRGKKKE